MQREILVGMADSHGGNNQGLLNPETVLERDDDSGQQHKYNPQPTPFQELIYEDYLQDIDNVKHLAGNDKVTLIHDGDLTQGNKYEENWVSSRLSDQIIIAYYNLLPWMALKNLEVVRLAKGTGAHTFKEGSSEILVSKLLQASFPSINIGCVYHGLIKINGLIVDYAHHGPHPGTREWLKGNTASLYLKDIVKRSLKRGIPPPSLVLRAHYHEYSRTQIVEEWGENEEYTSTLVTLPSFCGGGDNAIRASRSRDTLHIGMCAFEVVDGKLLDVHRFIEYYDMRTKEDVDD